MPSERTKVSVKVVDSSVCVSGAAQSASAVLYVGESEFSADLVGDSPETIALFDVSSATVLLTDDCGSNMPDTGLLPTHAAPTSGGVQKWKVCRSESHYVQFLISYQMAGYATFAELTDLAIALQVTKHPERVETRVRHQSLCHDVVPTLL